VAYLVISPPSAIFALSWFSGRGLEGILLEVAKGWVAQGVWTSLVVWCVWWPAWVLGGTVLWSGFVRA
jgi:glycosylphosphatidylinositol transamidase